MYLAVTTSRAGSPSAYPDGASSVTFAPGTLAAGKTYAFVARAAHALTEGAKRSGLELEMRVRVLKNPRTFVSARTPRAAARTPTLRAFGPKSGVASVSAARRSARRHLRCGSRFETSSEGSEDSEGDPWGRRRAPAFAGA